MICMTMCSNNKTIFGPKYNSLDFLPFLLHMLIIPFIVRFSATKAMWILSPFHPIRRIALTVFTHPMFGFAIITTILVNCKVMTMPESE